MYPAATNRKLDRRLLQSHKFDPYQSGPLFIKSPVGRTERRNAAHDATGDQSANITPSKAGCT